MSSSPESPPLPTKPPRKETLNIGPPSNPQSPPRQTSSTPSTPPDPSVHGKLSPPSEYDAHQADLSIPRSQGTTTSPQTPKSPKDTPKASAWPAQPQQPTMAPPKSPPTPSSVPLNLTAFHPLPPRTTGTASTPSTPTTPTVARRPSTIPSLDKHSRDGKQDLVEIPPRPLQDELKLSGDNDSFRLGSGSDVEMLERKGGATSSVVELGTGKSKKGKIQWKSCTWQKTAAILFGEYICMAILAFPWAYSILGLIPGIIASVCVSASVCYTSLTLWKYCLRHPECEDICSLGQSILGGGAWAWWFTMVMFVLNNTFIQGMHVVLGGMFLNTLTGHSMCTVYFYIITAVVSFFLSLPRPFSALSTMAGLSGVTTFLMILLSIIFSGVLFSRSHASPPTPAGTPIGLNLWPKQGTTYIQGAMAFLNIAYTFIGQLALPTFIAEMKNPMQFPRVVYAVSFAELAIAVLAGSLILYFKAEMAVGEGREVVFNAPEFTDNPVFKKICICFGLPTILFLGVMFSTLSSKFLFFLIFPATSRHRDDKTLKSRLTWCSLHALTWTAAFLIASVIPIFSDLLGLMCAVFDSFLGFIFWGLAWIRLRKEDIKSQVEHERALLVGGAVTLGGVAGRRRWWKGKGLVGKLEVAVNLGLLV
ncbi:hypothetical protein BJ508DRAFT_173398, partial [Ascobolus immersus RN42]